MKLKTKVLTITSSLLLAVGNISAQTPKDQIALQLGAMQMGYTVPFTISANSTTTQKQQAVNALVMGRNAMNATATLPAVTVKGVVKSPNVNTIEYRDQLYSAVEYVVTAPVNATINGTATMSNNSTVTVPPTILSSSSASNDWMTPVPYALEAQSSVDTQMLRAELVAAGVLKAAPTPSDPTFVFCVNVQANNNTVAINNSKMSFYTEKLRNGSFETFITKRLAANDRILTFNYDLLKEAESTSNYLNRTKITLNFANGIGEPSGGNLMFYIAIPATHGTLKTIKFNGFTQTVEGPFSTSENLTRTALIPIKYKNVNYNVYRLTNSMPPSKWEIYLGQ